MTNYPFKLLILLFVFSCFTFSCTKEDEPDLATFSGVIDNGGGFEDPTFREEVTPQGDFEEERDGVIWKCTREKVNIQAGAGGNGGFPMFSPNSNVVYPGNLLQGGTLNQGTPDVIAVERASGIISTDVADGNIQSSFEVEQVTKSSVTDAINNIIAGSTGVIPSNFNVSIKNVQSREQFALALGLNINSTFVDIEADLNYSSDVAKSSFIVNLNQSFYTMSFDIPTSLDKLFASSVSPTDLARYVGPGNPATYISDVTYGRIYYMMIQSSSSSTAVSAAINASFNGLVTQVDGSLETDYLSTLDNLEISVFAYGGAASSTLRTIGVSDLGVLADLLSESSDIGSGKPISYVVRSAFDNQIVSTQLATEYDVVDCKPGGPDGAPPYTEHWTGEVISRMGPVGAAFSLSGTEFILINQEGDQYMQSSIGTLEGPFPVSNWGAEAPFKIGAAVNINGNSADNGNSPLIQIWDQSGTQFEYFNWKNGSYLGGGAQPIQDLLNDGSPPGPFDGVGIGAAAFKEFDPFYCCASLRIYFDRDGDRYAQYDNSPRQYGRVYDLYDWGVDGSISTKINGVGAAIGFKLADEVYTIMFNEAGTKYVYYGLISGEYGVIGPFDL